MIKCVLVAAGLAMMSANLLATPIEPTRDDQVIEVLPGQANERAEQRRQRQSLAARPLDAKLALSVATRLLEQAHELGDPRFAGQAMAALEPWTDEAAMPLNLLLMKAILQQYLHQFDASAALLKRVVERNPADAQAWITLATVRRVQGRYADSDAACQRLIDLRAALHGKACLAENAALRGQWDASRKELNALLAAGDATDSQRAWLLTSLAELEQRAGNAKASEAAYKAVLKLGPDPYATLAYADLLLEQNRPGEALRFLQPEVRTDAVVLRLAIAGTRTQAPSAAADVTDMRERIALANMRPEAKLYHGREQAMFELHVEGHNRRAFELAKLNATNQREPLDILVLALTARAMGDAASIAEARKVSAEMGLRDRRIDALL